MEFGITTGNILEVELFEVVLSLFIYTTGTTVSLNNM